MRLVLYTVQSVLVFAVFVALIDMSRSLEKLQRRVRALEDWIRNGR